MRTHIIENGVVINTIMATVAEAEAAFPEAVCIDAARGGGIGWTWDGEKLTEPAAPPAAVPEVVTIRQARLALLSVGLLDSVVAAIATMDRPAQIDWEYATEVRRDWPTLIEVQSVLKLTDIQVDELFALAATL